MPPSRSHRPRVASAHVFGRPLKRPERNAERARLLIHIAEAVAARSSWRPLEALLLPAGFFNLAVPLGPLAPHKRAAVLERSEIGEVCVQAAGILASGGATLLVVGLDTQPFAGFSGDQFMAAWTPSGVLGSARKVFPSSGDTLPTKRHPYVLFGSDADDIERIVTLPGGSKAVLCVCYDAFAFSELARGPTGSRAAMRYLWGRSRHEGLSAAERNQMLDRFETLIRREAPQSTLVAIHGFDQPGRETRWQRHGIASASAGLGGGLAVGAAHFRYWLPDHEELDHAPLASYGVGKAHLTLGLHRKARKLAADDALLVRVRGEPRLRAVVRFFAP